MAGDASLTISWHQSAATGSLGGGVSGNQLRADPETVSTAAAVGDTRLEITDTANYSGYLYVRDGAAGGFASRIVDNEGGAPGFLRLLDPLPFAVGIGDSVWNFRPNYVWMPFKDSTPAECAAGFVHYSGHYITNGGPTLSNARVYLEEILPGPVVHEIAVSNRPASLYTLATIPDEETAPDLSSMLASGGSGAFSRATFANPNPGEFAMSAQSWGFWIRRTSPAGLRSLPWSAVAVVVEDSITGRLSKAVLTWNNLGFTEILELAPAPSIYVGGGARFRARVTSDELGLPVPGIPVLMTANALANGTFTPPAEPAETGDLGTVEGTYVASEDPADIGGTIEVEATI